MYIVQTLDDDLKKKLSLKMSVVVTVSAKRKKIFTALVLSFYQIFKFLKSKLEIVIIYNYGLVKKLWDLECVKK